MSYGEGAKLIATRPGAPGQEFPLGARAVVIGRDPTCDIVVDSPVVSRQHARVEPQDGDYIVEDAGATNGLFVNGRRIEGAHVLVPGDKIQVGEENLVYMPGIADAMQTQIVRTSTAPIAGTARPQTLRPSIPAWPTPSGAAATPPPPPPPPVPETPDAVPERPSDETTILPRPAPRSGAAGFQAPPPPPPPPSGWETPAQHATSAQLAGFWRRFGGLIIDGIIVGVFNEVLDVILRSGGTGPGLLSLVGILVGLAYYTWGFGSGQTVACRVLNLRIVDEKTGGMPGYGKGLGRYFASILSVIPIFLGYFWMLWDSKSQTWQDKLAGTLVVYEGERRVNDVRFNLPQ